MSSPALQTYLDRLSGPDVAATPGLTALDEAIVAVEPGFAVAVKYKILMYAMPGDWRHWVCATSANRGGISLRFLYGVLLDDPLGVLRWDFANDDQIPAGDVGRYVRDALGRLEYFRADSKRVAAETKAALAAEKERRAGRR
jgi:hypothetical protein